MDKKEVKMGDICILINGDRGKNYPSQADIVADGEIPFINAGHLVENRIDFEQMNYISREKFEKLSSGKISDGDILYCLRGSLGKKAIISGFDEGAIASSLVIIRPDRKFASSEYLSLALESSSIATQLYQANNGSSQPNLSAKSVREYKIALHNIEDQNIIVTQIGKVKNLIDYRKEQMILLDSLVKSRFVEMFGDPVANNMGWDVVKLKKLATKILSGNTPKGGSQVYVDDGIMFFRSQNVWKNRIELDDIAYIDENTHKSMAKSSLKYKDILMTKTGRINTENSSLGRAAMYMGADDQANINGHVYMIRMNDKAVKEFVLFIITTLEYRDYIRSVCVGGIDKRQLNKNHIEDFPIIMPPRDKQEEFVSIWKQVNKLKVKVQESLEENQTLFDLLMQKYFD